MQSDEPDLTRLLQHGTDPGAEGATVTAHVGAGDLASAERTQPTSTEWKRKWLTGCLTDLQSTDSAEVEAHVEHALVTSIVVIMDAAGTSLPRPQGKMDLRVPAGFQMFAHNESYYKFRIGEFPEFDELMEFRARRAAWSEARPWQDPDPRALDEWRKGEPVFPQELIKSAMDRTEEALALVQK